MAAMRTINGIRYRPEEVERYRPILEKSMRGRGKRTPNKGRSAQTKEGPTEAELAAKAKAEAEEKERLEAEAKAKAEA